jgi:hypothetical protein
LQVQDGGLLAKQENSYKTTMEVMETAAARCKSKVVGGDEGNPPLTDALVACISNRVAAYVAPKVRAGRQSLLAAGSSTC